MKVCPSVQSTNLRAALSVVSRPKSSAAALRSTPETAMMQKFVVLAVVTLAGAALFVPDATFARGGMGGGIGGFRAGGFRASAVIHRAPFMVRTGRSALGHNGFARTTH